jgi:hypothetical protein
VAKETSIGSMNRKQIFIGCNPPMKRRRKKQE